MIFNLLEGVCPSHYFAVFCSTQPTLSATQSGYGGSTSQGDQASAGGYAMPQGFRVAGTKSYNAYQSTVYEPFTTAAPSDNHPMATGAGEPQITDRKNLTGVGDPDADDLQSPVGEPLVLLFFAAVAALFVARRKRQTA